ncbi:AAA family ATPase [Candidatus Woesearchaeota archaeon]|nr:AAA family ATPase [Candidatus Woesearchaeota archaeon]
MTTIVFIRGSPAVGKTTITKRVLHGLKESYGLHCAYIGEDYFRKEMQFKYKSSDLTSHLNSVELIKTIILKLMQLDNYDFIFIDGLFRFKEVMEKYNDFINERGFKATYFYLHANIEEMVYRDKEFRNTKSSNIYEVNKDINSYMPNYFVKINTEQEIEESVNQILLYLLT